MRREGRCAWTSAPIRNRARARCGCEWRLAQSVAPICTSSMESLTCHGWRTLRVAGDAAHELGLYGFGAAAHLIAQVAIHQGRRVYAFTRPGDTAGQAFARTLGAVWAGDSDQVPPVELDAAIIFAPVGALVPVALRATRKGGS